MPVTSAWASTSGAAARLSPAVSAEVEEPSSGVVTVAPNQARPRSCAALPTGSDMIGSP